MTNTSETNAVEKIKTHFMFYTAFWKWCRSWDNVEKYCRAGENTDDNKAYAFCMPAT